MDGSVWAGEAGPRAPGDWIRVPSYWPHPLSFPRPALGPCFRACELWWGILVMPLLCTLQGRLLDRRPQDRGSVEDGLFP